MTITCTTKASSQVNQTFVKWVGLTPIQDNSSSTVLMIFITASLFPEILINRSEICYTSKIMYS